MKTPNKPGSHQPSESPEEERTDQRKSSNQGDVSDEVLRSKTTGVGKARRKTRRGKKGGARHRTKEEHKKLQKGISEFIKDVRLSMEASKPDHAPSPDPVRLSVDRLASDIEEMFVTPSPVEPIYDYEHYFPEEIIYPENNKVIDKREGAYAQAGSDGIQGYSYHDNASFIDHGYGQTYVDEYGYEANGHGCVCYGYGYKANGHGCVCYGYEANGHGCVYCGYGYEANGHGCVHCGFGYNSRYRA